MSYKVALIILYDSENRFLLQHRSKDARLLPDHWAFFGGGLKDNESPQDALRREALEEINHKVRAPSLIHEQDFEESGVRGHIYLYIEPFKADKSTLKLGEGQNWGWFSRDETSKLKMIKRDRKIIDMVAKYLAGSGILAKE